jgi:hypothetical protein
MLPIRKVSPHRVALTSYYGKVFVERSQRSVNNYGKWLSNQLTLKALDENDADILESRISNIFKSTNKTPRIYSLLARTFRDFKTPKYSFYLEFNKREEFFGKELVAKAEKAGGVVVGRLKSNSKVLIVVDEHNTFYEFDEKGLKPLGKLEDILNIDVSNAPVEMAELKVFNKFIPVGFVLGYYIGLNRLLKLLKVNYRKAMVGERLELNPTEFTVRFSDEILIFDRDDQLASIILGGFNLYHRNIKSYSIYDFDKRDVYGSVLDANKVGSRYLRELDLLRDMFIDPITRDLLVTMGEPTDWLGLMIRSSELLLTDYSPSETDLEWMRIKGYERVAGTVYGELVKSVRLYNARGTGKNNRVELSPNAVWQTLQEDPSKGLVEELNPIENLREKEVVTYSGHGGRSRRSMVKSSRVYTESDMGVISEGTVDSGDVGIVSYLTADPNFTNLRGLTRRKDFKTDGPAKFLSTAAMLSPAADREDPKRTNFIGIQHHSGMAAKGYQTMPLRTGYELVVAQRTDDLFAYTAKKEGKVTKVTDKSVTVEYKDGEVVQVEIGRRYGTAAGFIYPHSVVTDLKEGDRVKPGDCVTYNDDFFKPNPLNPREVIWKAGVLVKTAILESPDTLEDSSAISEKVAEQLRTRSTKVRDITLSFDQTVRNLVKVGQTVESDSILCFIEDSVTADNELFDENSLDLLRLMSSQAPKAKYSGVVEKIEVYYNGDKEDMSESLRALANASDRERSKLSKELGKATTDGGVDGTLRVGGNPLDMDNLVIKVYITGEEKASVGDKGVFANQMKTVFGRVMTGRNETESGEEIGALFGLASVSDRQVHSPFIIGTTNRLLGWLSKHVSKVYREG